MKNYDVWFTLESDAGEVIFPDFVSMGMSVDDVVFRAKILNDFLINKYNIKY